MKKFLVLFFVLSVVSFCQVRTFVDSLATSGTNNHYVARGYEFAVLTVTLPNANDTVKVWVGTNEASPKYGQIMVTDAYADQSVLVITGNTTTNRKYFIKWRYRQKYIRLTAHTNSAKVYYTLEAY